MEHWRKTRTSIRIPSSSRGRPEPIRLAPITEHFLSGGSVWQTRLDDTLRRAIFRYKVICCDCCCHRHGDSSELALSGALTTSER